MTGSTNTKQGRSKPDPDSTAAPSAPTRRRLPPNRQRSSKKKPQPLRKGSTTFQLAGDAAELPSSSSSSSSSSSHPCNNNDLRTMKELQNRATVTQQHTSSSSNSAAHDRARQKAAEDAATRIATKESLSDQGRYDSGRWEQLVSKQEELMNDDGGDSKPRANISGSRTNRRQQQQQRSRNTSVSPSPALPPTSLTRGRPSVQAPEEQVLPGAFRMQPSMGATPALGLAEGETIDNSYHNRPIMQPPQDSRRTVATNKEETTREEDILIEAHLVVDGDDTEMPTSSSSINSSGRTGTGTTANTSTPPHQPPPPPIYPEPELVMGEPMGMPFEKQPTNSKQAAIEKERSKRLRWILIAVCLLITFVVVAGSIVGVRVGKNSSNKDEENQQEADTTASSSGSGTTTTSGGDGSPTMAPTAFTQSVLPPYTQQTLNNNDPSSPQSRAYEWLRVDMEQQQTEQDGQQQEETMHTYFPLQRFALATLFYSLQGSTSWKENDGWLQEGTDPCDDWYTTFYGVICTNGRRRLQQQHHKQQQLRGERDLVQRGQGEERRYYQRLSLFQNGLTGSLPPEIGLLTKLDVVDLHSNLISGPVPSELGLLQDVTLFQIFNNTLSGSLPAQLSQLTRIRHLNFAFNRLTGTIPPQLSQLSSTIEVFSISNNQVTGTIPSQLGLLSSMVGLHLYGNPQLGGSLPKELAQMTQLQKLHLNGIGRLTGTIPPQYGIGLVQLRELQLEDNAKLHGPIPSTLGSLSQLTKLTLHNTDLSGSLPFEICDLIQSGKLKTLSVDCDKVQCPVDCQCNCHTFPPRSEQEEDDSVGEGGDGEDIVIVEGITDPPILVNAQVGPTEDSSSPPPPVTGTTSASVGGFTRPPRL